MTLEDWVKEKALPLSVRHPVFNNKLNRQTSNPSPESPTLQSGYANEAGEEFETA